jgi:LacI family transcriptional regulator
MRRPTINDVARLAGVGKVTVSYVLNGQSRSARISEETEKRVMAAARDLEYRPNRLARMLANKRTESIAVVFQYADLFSSGSGFINEVMRGVCAATVDLGFDLMLHTKAVNNPIDEANVLSDGRVDGALALRDEDDPTILSLLDRNFPTVQFFCRCDHPNAIWVDADNVAGAMLATKHLLDLGHRQICMIEGPVHSVAAKHRQVGFRQALEDALIAPIAEGIHCGNPVEAEQAIPAFLATHPKTTALFCWSDEVAVRAVEVARGLGIRVPSQLSIVGFDSLEICNRSHPPLTSVRQPVFEIAERATKMLIRATLGEPIAERNFLFPLTLDVRGSTGPAQNKQK